MFGCRLHCVCLRDFNNRFADGDWANRCFGRRNRNKSARFENIFHFVEDVVVANVFHHFAHKRKALGREIAGLKKQVLSPGFLAWLMGRSGGARGELAGHLAECKKKKNNM
jgi:hypothetical protein